MQIIHMTKSFKKYILRGISILIAAILLLQNTAATQAVSAIKLVDDINPIKFGEDGSYIMDAVLFNGNLYFAANGSAVSGTELWMYDGVNASLVADIYSGPQSSLSNNFNGLAPYIRQQLHRNFTKRLACSCIFIR